MRKMLRFLDTKEADRIMKELEDKVRTTVPLYMEFREDIFSFGIHRSCRFYSDQHDILFEDALENEYFDMYDHEKGQIFRQELLMVDDLEFKVTLTVDVAVPKEYRLVLHDIGRIKVVTPEPQTPYYALACGDL